MFFTKCRLVNDVRPDYRLVIDAKQLNKYRMYYLNNTAERVILPVPFRKRELEMITTLLENANVKLDFSKPSTYIKIFVFATIIGFVANLTIKFI